MKQPTSFLFDRQKTKNNIVEVKMRTKNMNNFMECGYYMISGMLPVMCKK